VGTAALWAAIGLLGVLQAALGLLVLHLVKQQGRLLLRLETLERRPPAAVPPGDGQAAASSGQPAAPSGLSVGTLIEPFRLPSIAGGTVALEDFRGKRVLLVNWHPACGFCSEIAADLALLEPKLRARNIELLLASAGGAEENRRLAGESGLRALVLLQDEEHSVGAFHGLGTPVAYLLDEEGRIAEPLAFGALEVPELARRLAMGRKRLSSERSLADSRLERNGLEAGTPAPAFSLPAIEGEEISLADYRGRPVLLVFSDPDCGPCNELGPELAELARNQADGLAVLMVSRGEIDANRRKTEEHGIDFPVVIQPGWKLSKEYGIFATPVAFLIGEDGVIARDVAQGREQILALAASAETREEAPIHQ
jgi:peroxiredoxin